MRSTSAVEARPVRIALEVALHGLDGAGHLVVGVGDDLGAHVRRTSDAAPEAPEMRVPTGSPAATRVMLSGRLRSKTTIGQVVLHAQAHGRRVEDLELVAEQVRVVEMSVAPRIGVRHRVFVVDAVDLGRLEQDLGVDLDRAQGGGGVGREVRVAGAGHEERDAALLEVADGAPPDVRLGDLVHRDRGHDPGRDAGPLERVLEGQAVHDRREHADVVAGRAVHPARRRGQAAEDVAATDDDPDLDAEAVDLRDLAGDERADGRVDAVLAIAEQRLAGQLEQDPPVAQRRRLACRAVAASGHSSSPSA